MLDAPSESTAVPALFSLKGKVSFVTGGVRGIGLQAAKGLAEAGSSVAITYSSSSEEEVKEAIGLIQTKDVTVKAYKLDVSSKEDIDRVTDQVEADLGRLDVVVINAGVSYHIPAAEYPADKFRKQMQVNLDGAFFCAQAAHHVFKKQQKSGKLRQGSIIFTASISGRMVNTPQPQAPYNSSKAGLIGLAKCLAYEWTDVCKVNCVSPGYIATDMIGSVRKDWTDEWLRRIPGGRMCSPHELKGIYVFLASDASSYMTGSDVVMDGGYSLM
ncbi:hypothetical protein TRICI_006322 [Trichomonascus ciferrii]|uniref:Uncharacterized protein n=1 Tax=Trichomonascus ciferrii TaxID=44093 RepID=A0A642UIF0_9ASCO|nr:hypothetical protein TRICI_006322 [Trichomonascus ciferrii]